MSIHRWATEEEMAASDNAKYTRLRGTEWDRAAWTEFDIDGTLFAVCPECQTLVRCTTPDGSDGLLRHRTLSHRSF